MRLYKTTKWQDPIAIANAASISEDVLVFLYSGLENDFTGSNSYLALRPKEQISESDFEKLDEKLKSNSAKFENAWFGYLGYGLKNCLEKLPEDTDSEFNFNELWFARFGLILHFDHELEQINIYADSEDELKYIPEPIEVEDIKVNISDLSSNMTKKEYLRNVDIIKDAICRGDLYQANLTRKFSGKLEGEYSPFAIFSNLAKISPAPYSSFIKIGDKTIISSSPERFLHIDENGNVDTRPIKGSAARSQNIAEDEALKQSLANSEKDRAENLMIVDLCRNDLARSCYSGTVETKNLFEISSYATVHHMASTVIGQKRDDRSTLDLIKGCFPPGSMTGAPKIKAMELCTQIEKVKRGIYSGAIGWFGGDGSSDLCVVIRTIITQGNRFEFQVGGAIVYDSIAQLEFEETLTKAKAICMALGMDNKSLQNT